MRNRCYTREFTDHVGCPVIYAVENIPEEYPAKIRHMDDKFVYIDFDDPKYGNNVMVSPRTLSLVCDIMHTSTA